MLHETHHEDATTVGRGGAAHSAGVGSAATDEGLGAPQLDVIGTILRCRRAADLSQRDLAALLGVCPSTVARWENGTRMPSADMLLAIVSLAGFRLVMLDEQDQQVEAAPTETLRDRGGRRMPAHLDVHLWDETVWDRLPNGGWRTARRTAHAPRRYWRDHTRRMCAEQPVRTAPGCSPFQGGAFRRVCHDFTTARDIEHWRASILADRAAQIAARRARWPEPEPEPCFCDVECHEHHGCAPDCPCACED